MFRRFAHHLTQHFIPTPHNGFVPHLLRERHVWAMLGVGLALFSFVQVARVSNYFGLMADVYPAVVISLTNKDREANDLPTLSVNETLMRAAKLKAEDMASKGYFAHTSPEGLSPWHWFSQAGYSFIYAGENLAINYDESDAVQAAWLDSPTHRANIMNENFTEMGVATTTGIYNGVPTTFVVEMFGMPATPRVAAAKPSPVAATPAVTTPQPAPVPSAPPSEVAGQSTPTLAVLEETPVYSIVQNTDTALEPGNPTPAPMPKVSFVNRLVMNSGRIAGMVIQLIIIVAIITTAGMVAREYEKHHKKHMAYGVLVAVIMFAFLFVGQIGVFDQRGAPLASASKQGALR